MTPREFCYWLQGLFELTDITQLDPKQTQLIRNHLNMVFAHTIDPSQGPPEHQALLQELHDKLEGVVKKVNNIHDKNSLIRC